MLYLLLAKTTIDLPDDLLHRAKIVAAERRTTLKELVVAGLNQVVRSMTPAASGQAQALACLEKGLRLGGHPLQRNQTHLQKVEVTKRESSRAVS